VMTRTIITQARFGCGPGRTLVAGRCVARTTIRHARRAIRRDMKSNSRAKGYTARTILKFSKGPEAGPFTCRSQQASDAIKRPSDRKKRGDPPTAEWTPTKMAKMLPQLVEAKDHKLRNVASSFDECFLAIVTDEPGIDEWLSRDAAEETRPVSPCYVTERRAGAKNKPAGFWCRRAISNRKLDQNSAGR
jgi:hypothetical protein